MSLTYELTLAGLAVGSAAALSGIGVVVTYRATGVLNLAHGAVAMFTAYVMRQLAVGWDWPLWAAAAVSLLVVAPGIGLLMGRFVFRPLSVLQSGGAGAGGAQALVASLGVFVLLMGAAGLLWGTGARTDAPELLPSDPWVQLGTAVALAGAVAAVTRWTRFGRELRAVVDNRRLAALSGIDADRVADAGWAFGTFTAGVTGVLLAPEYRLDPYGLPLLVMAVIGVAVAAGLRSLPAVVAVALAVGVGQAQLTRLHPGGWGEQLVQALGANLFAVLLLVAALALPRLWTGSGDGFLRVPADTLDSAAGDGRTWLVAGVLFLLPLGFAGSDLTTSVQVPALAVVLLSLVVVTGRGGQVSLGQAAYAGLGALFTALLAAGRFPGLPELPELVALGVAVLLVAPLGLLTGYPAIRRQGLALALVTLAVGVAVSRFVFAQPYATSGLTLGRPAGFTGDRAFYVLELVLLAGALTAAHALRRGRPGRALAAMRDHESGAAAAGVPVPSLKVAAFAAGAALAALGGGMLAMGARAFDPNAFDPVRSLLWFAAVVVVGADSMLGALLASALLVGLDAGTRGGMAAAVIGVLAVLLGRFPGGLYEALHRAASRRLRRPGLTPRGLRLRTHLAQAPRAVGTTRVAPPAGAAGTGPLLARTVAGPRPAQDTDSPAPAARRGKSGAEGTAEPGPAEALWPRDATAELASRATAGAAEDPGGRDTPGPAAGEAARPSPVGRSGAEGARAPGRGPTSAVPNTPEPSTGEAPQRVGGAEPDSDVRAAGRRPASGDPDAARNPDRRDAPAPPAHTGTQTDPDTRAAGRRPTRGDPDHARNPDRRDAPAPPAHTGTQTDPDTRAAGRRPTRGEPDHARTPDRRDAPAPPTDQAAHPPHTDAHSTPDTPAAGRRPTHEDPDHARNPDRPHAPAPPAAEAAPPPPPHTGNRSATDPRAAGRRPPRGARRARPSAVPAAGDPLVARGVSVSYGDFSVLSGVDLRVAAGQVTALVGPNGAGKSTLFHCLAGTLRPRAGRVVLDGRDVTRRSAHARNRLGLARTFQQPAVFPTLTVAENVGVGAEQGRVRDPAATDPVLRLLGLDGPLRDAPAEDLPTGVLRRVELGRALAGGPRVLLLDEPAAGLDLAETAALVRVLRALAADGTALLVVEHDLELVGELADTVYAMAAGRIVASGTAAHVLAATGTAAAEAP
ncbi:ATP-binding cassette domain-containing protein [Streptomyces sp. WMMC500]|uniref:branched-chain amino acid ABC transporter permease/ATP-binding protein n=1 Tax=Streptomyces sp. WMMC500 TaxID=3015154 RepID=UPI00248C8DCC|nr:ATP-binding cassette domain-containing protein [Streptomyces sp. WMMC500]WBB60184.1 ATP-binding cassette domain-containing protein [Streptomyces sp. WMMC500]